MVRRRRRNRGPQQIRRIAFAMMILASLLGAYAGARDSSLAITGALALAVAGAFTYARAADMFMDFDLKGTRRQAWLLSVLGLGIGLLGCSLTSILTDDPTNTVRAIGYGAIAAGAAFGLAGLSTLLWSTTTTYAGKHIQNLGEDDW